MLIYYCDLLNTILSSCSLIILSNCCLLFKTENAWEHVISTSVMFIMNASVTFLREPTKMPTFIQDNFFSSLIKKLLTLWIYVIFTIACIKSTIATFTLHYIAMLKIETAEE